MTYYDKAKVNLITNLFDMGQWLRNSQNTKALPIGIYWYRKWLGNLDHFDRWLHQYLSEHRNIKWTMALLKALLKIAVNNTCILAQELGFGITLKECILQVVDHLAGTHSLREEASRPAYKVRTTGHGHWPKQLDKPRPCAYCMVNNKKSNTTYSCSICEAPLHALCFSLYHVK